MILVISCDKFIREELGISDISKMIKTSPKFNKLELHFGFRHGVLCIKTTDTKSGLYSVLCLRIHINVDTNFNEKNFDTIIHHRRNITVCDSFVVGLGEMASKEQ